MVRRSRRRIVVVRRCVAGGRPIRRGSEPGRRRNESCVGPAMTLSGTERRRTVARAGRRGARTRLTRGGFRRLSGRAARCACADKSSGAAARQAAGSRRNAASAASVGSHAARRATPGTLCCHEQRHGGQRRGDHRRVENVRARLRGRCEARAARDLISAARPRDRVSVRDHTFASRQHQLSASPVDMFAEPVRDVRETRSGKPLDVRFR